MGKSGFCSSYLRLQARGRLKLAYAVVRDGVCFGKFVALPFARNYVQKLRTFEQFDVLQGGYQRFHIVPVYRADVVEAKFFKQGCWQHHAFGLLFKPAGKIKQRRHALEHAFAHITRLGVKLPAEQMRQIAVKRPYWRAYAHVVIVKDNQQSQVLRYACIIQAFKCHARSHGTIANHRYAMALASLVPRSNGHTKRRRNTG